ncbi:50S ribosomal protein L35 [Candidatus Microgenomates bacterium]|nr:50S ribosomal protein L35 [Candidatus Microgenomates bacterium]
MKKTKMKARKSAIRRFKVTATGKILHLRSFRRHLKSTKSKRARNQKPVKLTGANFKKVRRILGIR